MGKKLQGFVATAVVLLGLAPGAVALDKGPISSGETRSGTFTAGSNDVWSFTYAAGQVLNMRAAPPAPWSDRVETTIRDAGGTVRQTIACTGGTTNSASFVLPSTGTYTATVRSCSSTYAGAYNLSLLNVTAGPLRVTGDPTQEGQAIVSGQTVPGYMGYGDLDAFTLRVDAGERLVFSSSQQAVGPNPKLWLFPPITAPSPWVSLTSGNGDRQELSLTYPGTYTVVIQPQDLNSYGDYFLTLQKLPGATADCYTGLPDTDGGVIAAAPTANRSGSIVRKTDLDAYEFYATASQTATITTNRNLRVSLYAPQYVSYQREYGVPIFTNTATCTTSTTNNVTLPTSGFYELLVEECAVTAGGAYTVSLTLPAQTTPPPLVNPTPAACGNITNVFATDALSWDILPAGTNYQVYAQQWPLGGIGNLGNVIQPPSGRPVFPLPYETLLTGNIYSWYASAWDTLAYTYSPTYTFGLFCTPTVTVSPSSLDFGDVNVGSTSAPVTVTITNTGTCYEDPRVVSLPAAFAVLNDTCTSAPAGGHLAPSGDACSFQVTFSPTSQGPYAGGLTLDGFLPEAHGGIIDLAGRGIMPDLLLTALSDPPPAPLYGEYVDMTDTTENLGDGPAAASSVTYVFSADQVIDPADPPALSGARATPVLAPAATSTGTTSVYLPENLPTGSWYVGACIDAADLIPESDENNNCIVSATAFLVSRDMAVVEVSDPAQPNPDGTFAFSDTTRNTGSQPVPATVTNYRLSLDQKISRLDPTFALTRAIPALTTNPDPGHVSLGSVVLTVPADTPRGSYYVAACADATAVVGESSETNNCRFSKTTIRVEPDLTVTAVTNPPAAGSAGTTFSVTDTTRNGGLAGAAASSTRYRLSLDTAITTTDPQLTGNRAVPALGIGEVSTGSITVTIPASVPQGTFYLAACADDGRVIPEADETNNCRVSTTTISITRPDLVVTAVGNPPASGSAGTSFSVTDTTRNNGSAAAGATATGFRLSSDATITTSDPALTGTRAVPALAALGGTSSGSATVTIPASIAPGLYYLGACADNANSAAESVETNNCLGAATRITVGAPDLRVTALANPPASALVGTPFGVTDTTANASATVAAVASVTKYRLSLDTTITANDPLLTGTRAVPALAASANSAGTVNVTIPASIAPGTYYLGACADDGKTVAETDEANNCRVSTTTLNLQKPDLSVSAVSDPPAAGLVGDTFSVTDTTANGGAIAAGASTTSYHLSTDATISTSDPLLTGTRAVPALGTAANSAGSATVTIPASIPQGTFYLGACADEPATVSESNETNNCRASATQIAVSKPNLRVTSVSEPPLEGDLGQTFDVTDTTLNDGVVGAAASSTRYRLSLDTVITSADPLLTGARSVPALGGGADSTGTVTVTVPTTVVQGSYYLGACADDANVVAEVSDSDNCAVSTGTLDVLNADLRVTAVTDPPAEGVVGTIFSVTDTTANTGAAGAARTTTTRYRLSLDVTIGSADPLLTGTRVVPALAAGTDSTGTVSLTIPAAVAQGVYFLAACADDLNVLTESNETNNCRLAAGTIWVKKPDLLVTAVSDPPAEGFVGSTFSVTDTTENQGLTAAGASTTRYRLSTDASISGSDPLLTGTRSVAALGVGAASTGTVTLTIPSSIAQGVYYFAACADDATVVNESDETNNCRVAAATISLKKPDLVVTAASDPPATGTAGTTFGVTDTTRNNGIAPAAASTTRYRLSLDLAVTTADPLLTGTRAAGALAVGAESSGSVSVSIPGTVPEGVYHLAACADDTSVVSESSETNNCLVTAATIDLHKADLRITAVSNPPAGGVVGGSFSVTDTTENLGQAAAGSSTTVYRLSVDADVTAADPLLTGARAVPALGIGAGSTGAATVTIPASIPQGAYYLGACADDGGTVAESNEANNCRASATTIDLQKADLRVSAVSDPPAEGVIGAAIVITDTTTNAGAAAAVASTTRYRISADATITAADMLLTEASVRHTVPALNPGESSSASITVVIPSLAQGLFYVGACADENNLVSESSETNNCLAAAAQIMIKKPDLAVTAVTDPPATGLVGTAFSVTDTTANIGLSAAAASTTRYRLTADTTVTSADLLLTGTRAAGALGVGASSTGSVTVTIPASVLQGVYYLAACADDAGTVSESNETNNCRLSATTISLQKPDLRVAAVSDPPAAGTVGASFPVTDTTENADTALTAAGASTTRYRLSLDATISSADPLLTGTRAVGALAVGAASTGTVTVTIPASVAQGLYYLAACADDAAVVSESNETNNCFLAATRIQMNKPDLRATAVTDPPATGLVGASFTVTDTTANLATALTAAAASTTRFRLSTDTTITTADPLLTGTRAVGVLAIGEASSGSTVVTIPAGVPQGVYYLGACADDAAVVSESVETNNCVASATQIALQKADLRVTAVSDPPASGVAGDSFSVSDTTENAATAQAAAGASATRYRLSLDAAITGADPLLTGERALGALAVGASSAGSATVTIPASVSQGTYYLGACADDADVVSEADEANNCLVSGTLIFVQRPDLTVTAVDDPPAEGYAGGSFPAGDTTANVGISAAAASTTRYRLSLDLTVTTADPLLTGARAVGALAAGASSAGTEWVTIPTSIAEGDFHIAACADFGAVVGESNEANNCLVSAATINLWKANLAVLSLSGVPAEATAGYGTFDVSETTGNVSTHRATAVPTITRFYLSLDEAVTSADPVLTAERTVPALAAAADSTGTTTLAVPAAVAEGLYWLYACADATTLVTESSETNNCTHAAAQVRVWKPDLTYALQTGVTDILSPGQALTIWGTVTNSGGNGFAGLSTTKFYLSTDATITSADRVLTGGMDSPVIDPGTYHYSFADLTVPTSVPSGVYYFGACADAGLAVTEQSETNNCDVWGTTVQVRRPDLTVAGILNPPASKMAGETFDATDTTANTGLAPAGASTTIYRLSIDTTATTSDPLLTGDHAVPALDAAGFSTSTTTVTIPAGTAPGLYYLIGCADADAVVGEESETNNCRASSTRISVLLARPDLVVVSVSEPPASAEAGTGFSVTDETANISTLASSAISDTAYVLSTDTTIGPTDPRLTPTRSVASLGVGASSVGTIIATIPAGVAPGTYYFAACADNPGVITEISETNNCTFAAATIQVTPAMPDLTVVYFFGAPGTVDAGATIVLSDETRNQGAATAAASVTRYYLSADQTRDAGDVRLTGSRSVPSLAPGVQSYSSASFTVPSGTAGGSYWLLGCADDTSLVTERSETNNCLPSQSQIVVDTEPDLTLTVIDGARIDWNLSPGESFGEGITVTNIGNGAAGASTARFYLSTDAVITGADTLLTGTLANSALGAGASETDLTLVLTVPTSPPVPEGTYYFGACADDLNAVTESNETNNCDVEGSTWIVRWAALSVTTLANPPATVLQGGSFDVTDTTANTAAYGGDAVPFVNSYYLSSDSTITTGDTLLTGTRVINGLAAVDSSNGTITVTVPSGTPTGTYYLGVCADSTGVVPEANEANNCRASTGTITVQ